LRLFVAVGGLSLLLGAGCAPTSLLITPVAAKPGLDEQVIRRDSFLATRKIAVIDVDGLLINARSRSLLGQPGENPVATFTEKLDKARRDNAVAAVVLRINSPGGTVTATDLMYKELRRFRTQTGKPVVASLLDIAASGGYYLACAADATYAHPTSLVGSIGVVMYLPEFAGTMHKLGISVNTIKSGEMKDAGSMYRTMKPKEQRYFERLVDQMYGRFVDVVADSTALKPLADGRVYLGSEAVERGLIDGVGTVHDAIHAAQARAGLADTPIQVVLYKRALAHRPNVYAAHEPAPAQVNLINVTLPDWLAASPQFLYLWAPGW
jgi:protease-4